MKTTKLLLLLSLFLILLTNAAYPPDLLKIDNGLTNSITVNGEKKFSKQFTVKNNQTLKLDLEIGSDIDVKGWDKNIVDIQIIVEGKYVNDVDIEFEQTESGVTVHAWYNGSGNWSINGQAKIIVPKKFSLDYTTMGGSVSLNGIDGNLSGKTMGGALMLNNLKGKLNLTTMGGSIELKESDVDGSLETMGGNVLVENVTGNVDAKSMGGKITQKNVKSRDGKSIGKEVNVSTMGGEINVDEAFDGAHVNTMGGNISINKVKSFVDAKTMGGDVIINSAEGKVKAETMGGDIEVNVIGNKGDISLTSMSGDITLRVPSNFSMAVDIEVVYDKRHESKVGIESDFSIDKNYPEKTGKHYDDGRKTLKGKAELNGGQNFIHIITHNGKVSLLKN